MKKHLIAVLMLSFFSLSFVVESCYAYSNTVYNFSITPPEGWTTEENSNGLIVQFFGPYMNESQGNISMGIAVQSTSLALSGMVPVEKNTLQQGGWTIVSEGYSTVSGMSCYEFVVQATIGGNTLKERLVVFVENGREFMIAYAALPSYYDDYMGSFVDSLQTFRPNGAGQTNAPSQSGSDSTAGSTSDAPYTMLLVGIGVGVAVCIVLLAVLVLRRKGDTEKPINGPQFVSSVPSQSNA